MTIYYFKTPQRKHIHAVLAPHRGEDSDMGKVHAYVATLEDIAEAASKVWETTNPESIVSTATMFQALETLHDELMMLVDDPGASTLFRTDKDAP